MKMAFYPSFLLKILGIPLTMTLYEVIADDDFMSGPWGGITRSGLLS